MARRRFQRSKTAPDMGWIVGRGQNSFAKPAIGDGALINFLFDFADVDAEALTGRIEQDKSDWFVKRFIIESYTAASFTGTSPTDVARIFAVGLGIIGNEDANEIGTADLSVYSPEATNLYARTFRTYARPVYAGGLIPYANAAGSLANNPSTTPNSYAVSAPFWGPSTIRDDFEVSNAGLRNNQSCCLHLSMEPGPASYDWDEGDVIYFQYFYRVLMQKRRT